VMTTAKGIKLFNMFLMICIADLLRSFESDGVLSHCVAC
jgi:hypothetical protein